MILDNLTRAEIARAVSDTVAKAMEGYSEKWLSAQELCKECNLFTPSWIKAYGWMLPRTRIEVFGPEGEARRKSGWSYPLHKILRMVAEGQLARVTDNTVIIEN